MVNKLKVLESKIRNLEVLTDEVLNEVESAYLRQINELHKKKDVTAQKLSKLQKVIDSE